MDDSLSDQVEVGREDHLMPDVFDVRSAPEEVWNCLSGAAWIVTLSLEGS